MEQTIGNGLTGLPVRLGWFGLTVSRLKLTALVHLRSAVGRIIKYTSTSLKVEWKGSEEEMGIQQAATSRFYWYV